MSTCQSPTSCPPYIPATQITPDSVDNIQTQEADFFTQNSSIKVLFDSNEHENIQHNYDRNFYEQLLSSDSDDSTKDTPSNISTSKFDTSNLSSSNMSISSSDSNTLTTNGSLYHSTHKHNSYDGQSKVTSISNSFFDNENESKHAFIFDNIPNVSTKIANLDDTNSDMSISTTTGSFSDTTFC